MNEDNNQIYTNVHSVRLSDEQDQGVKQLGQDLTIRPAVLERMMIQFVLSNPAAFIKKYGLEG